MEFIFQWGEFIYEGGQSSLIESLIGALIGSSTAIALFLF